MSDPINQLKAKRILIFQQRNWGRTIGHPLACELQKQGAQLAALTTKAPTFEFIKNQKEVDYQPIINLDEIMNDPHKFLRDDKMSLDEICQELKVDTLWPMIQSNRLLVKSYDKKFYYSFRQGVSDEFIATYIKAFYQTFDHLFKNFKPEVIIIAEFIYDVHILLNLLANKYNIPVIALTSPRLDDYFIFSNSYQQDKGIFFDHLDKLNQGLIDTKNRQKAKELVQDIKKNLFKSQAKVSQKSIIKRIRHELSPFYHIFRWYFQPRPVNAFPNLTKSSIDYKPPKIILRDHYSYKRYRRFMDRFNYYPFEKLDKFIYFPLQVQPEMTIDLYSPYFSNQIETARQAAMSLPGDYTLVVKEHPEMVGLRPSSYIKKIAQTPNIKLIDYRIPTKDILERTQLIICPNGSTSAEAAFCHKPVIQLGDLGVTLKLPNVFKHSDLTTLSTKIKEILKLDLNTSTYDRRLENYVAAVLDKGVKIDYDRIWQRGDKPAVQDFYQSLKDEINRCIHN